MYFRIGAVVLGGELIVVPLSAYLLSFNPWLPVTIGTGLILLAAALSFFIPETLELRQAADVEVEQRLHRSDEDAARDKRTLREQIVFTMKNDMAHVYHFLIKSRRILALILAFNMTVIVKYVKIEINAQYVHNRFAWSWAKVSSHSMVRVAEMSHG